MVESPDQDLFPHLDAAPGAGVFYSHDIALDQGDRVSAVEKTIERIKLLQDHVRAIKTSVEAAPKYLDVLAWLNAFEAALLSEKLKLVSINPSTPGSTASSTAGMPFPPEADPASNLLAPMDAKNRG